MNFYFYLFIFYFEDNWGILDTALIMFNYVSQCTKITEMDSGLKYFASCQIFLNESPMVDV